MRLPDSTSLTNAVWSSYSEWAIWQSPWYEMRLSAPAVLLPEDSPDGLWHLFAHSWMGIEHYSSPSGFDWSKVSLVALRGHYPSLYRERNTWHLVYESHDRDYSGSIRLDRKRTISRIWMMSSSDLRNWSSPQMILSAADVPYASDFSVPRLAHPQIVPWEGGYRLYFTASELKLYDSGQKASACLSYACSGFINADYEVRQKPEHDARCSADRCHCAAFGTVLLHDVHEIFLGCQVGRAGHSSRENHDVVLPRAFKISRSLEFTVSHIGYDNHVVCARDVLVVMDRYHPDIDAASFKHIGRSQRLGLLETVGEKHVHPFHSYNVLLISMILYASTMSPTLMSLYPEMFSPQSMPVATSLTSSLNLLRDPSSPV